MTGKEMATKSENADIAVLQSQMATVIKGVENINTKLDTQLQLFVTKGEFDEFKKRWALSHTLVGLVSSTLTGLVVYFLTKA